MRLNLLRTVELRDETIGLLTDDDRPLCWILEDQGQPQGVKIPGETRIPAGIYDVRLYAAGRLHATYQRRWDWHRGMLQLMDVPGFSCILIHPGNDDDDTRGCLLPGLAADLAPPRVLRSRLAYEHLYRRVVAVAARHELDIAVYDPPQIVPGQEVA